VKRRHAPGATVDPAKDPAALQKSVSLAEGGGPPYDDDEEWAKADYFGGYREWMIRQALDIEANAGGLAAVALWETDPELRRWNEAAEAMCEARAGEDRRAYGRALSTYRRLSETVRVRLDAGDL
jgi:hypothetical protein